MRTITDHVVHGDQESQLQIEVHDNPGAGGANHAYAIYGFHSAGNASAGPSPFGQDETVLPILFQNGPIKEAGVNGITQEALLAIVIDRLRSFQAGPYLCGENAIALAHCEAALMWLQRRTVARIKRTVEGTHQK
jgi:hypothetical protein